MNPNSATARHLPHRRRLAVAVLLALPSGHLSDCEVVSRPSTASDEAVRAYLGGLVLAADHDAHGAPAATAGVPIRVVLEKP